MNKIKKLVTIVLSAAMILSAALPAYAANPLPFFGYFSGAVTEINAYVNEEGQVEENKQVITVENASGAEAYFITSPSTYFVDSEEIKLGDDITGYAEILNPMILIYPPSYNVDVIASTEGSNNIKVDVFDQDLLSKDQELKITVSEETEIISQNGEAYSGELPSKALVVIYDLATLSIPAQAPARKIIVLDREVKIEEPAPVEIVPVAEPVPVEEADPLDDLQGGVVINGEVIDALVPYENEDGILMVPLRAIAEKLGFEVGWNAETAEITIGDTILLKAGGSTYTKDGAEAQLAAALGNVEGRTFVPFSFIKDALGIEDVFTFEGIIVINTDSDAGSAVDAEAAEDSADDAADAEEDNSITE